MKKLISSKVKGMIIDLRNVSAGDLDEAVKAADLFLEEGQEIAAIKVKDREVENITATAESLVKDLPLILLVDSGTSFAAEVFAAALQDNEASLN